MILKPPYFTDHRKNSLSNFLSEKWSEKYPFLLFTGVDAAP